MWVCTWRCGSLLKEFGHVPPAVGHQLLAIVDHVNLHHLGVGQVLEELEKGREEGDNG